MCFADLQQARNSMDRTLLWEVLARVGAPPRLIKVVSLFYDYVWYELGYSWMTGKYQWFRVCHRVVPAFVPYVQCSTGRYICTVSCNRRGHRFRCSTHGQWAGIEGGNPRKEAPLKRVRREMWGTLSADDAGVALRSPNGLC